MDIQAQRPILPACSLARSHLSGEKQSANTHQCFAMSAFDPKRTLLDHLVAGGKQRRRHDWGQACFDL